MAKKEEKEVKTPKVKEEKEVKTPKSSGITITASYKQKNEEDGTFERITHKASGANLAECVKELKDYPKGLACNILVTLERNGKEATKNVAPMKARALLEDADEEVLTYLFRGI
jgi:hypothetical protein